MPETERCAVCRHNFILTDNKLFNLKWSDGMRFAFKVLSFGFVIFSVVSLSLLSGCANLNTISRTTPLKSEGDKGKAIHLDIQQRLLIVNNMDKYCSEPSPDALAAFAAAMGIGASSPAQGAVSGAGSTSSSAASIGLRTQSITLMRDALYRMCEAYANGELSRSQVMTTLSRSQDLTAVILATEQLTGAVVAQQAALSGTATSDATAVMTATSKLLEAALKQQNLAQTRLEQAMEKKADAESKQKQAQTEYDEAKINSDNNQGDVAAEARLKKAQSDLDSANRQVALMEEIRASREKLLNDATESVESLKSAQDSATTSASASSSSSASLSGGGTFTRLNDQSTQAIAAAVTSMVNNVVNKSYVLEYCMAMITSNDTGVDERFSPDDKVLCRDIVRQTMTNEQLRIANTTDTFAIDDLQTTNCIKSWLGSDTANKGKLDGWRNQNSSGTDHLTFMFGQSAAKLRSKAIKDLSITCN